MKAAEYIAKQSPATLAIGGAVVVAVLYFFGRKVVTDVAKVATDTIGGAVSGNNAITQNQTNASGEKTTAYEGAGVLGTLGATVNSALGGVPASIGEKLGGWAFDIFGPKTPN